MPEKHARLKRGVMLGKDLSAEWTASGKDLQHLVDSLQSPGVASDMSPVDRHALLLLAGLGLEFITESIRADQTSEWPMNFECHFCRANNGHDPKMESVGVDLFEDVAPSGPERYFINCQVCGKLNTVRKTVRQ